jgi:hypothetical protein
MIFSKTVVKKRIGCRLQRKSSQMKESVPSY